MRLALASLLTLVILAVAASSAVAAPAITEYPAAAAGPAGQHIPNMIITGPDGTMWFTDGGTLGGIGRVKLNGDLLAPAVVNSPAIDLAMAPDGTVNWTELDTEVGRRTIVGSIDRRNFLFGTPSAVTTDGDGVARFGTYDASVTSDSICWVVNWLSATACAGGVPTATASPLTGLTYGPDGRLWAAAFNDDRLLVYNGTGFGLEKTIVLAPDSNPYRVTGGVDGHVWVTNHKSSSIERVATDGTHSSIPLGPGRGPKGITSAIDGTLWIAETDANKIACMNTAGQFSEFDLPTAGSKPTGIAQGPDGAIWFTEAGATKIGRLVPDGPCISATPVDETPPAFVAQLKASPARFRVGTAKTATVAKKKPKATGTKLNFSLSKAATVTISIKQATSGRKVGKSCKPKSKSNKSKKKCTLVRTKMTFTRSSAAGANSVTFTGRVGSKSLKPGKYTAQATARVGAGAVSSPSTARLTVIK